MSDSPSYWITLLLISPPFGWVGLHHFYLGRNKRATLYVLLFVTGIPVLLATADALILLKNGREGFIEKHGTEQDMDEYYMKKLLERRPEMLAESSQKRQEYISKVTEEKDIEEEVIDEEKTDKDETESEEDAEETDNNESESEETNNHNYQDYYGNWD